MPSLSQLAAVVAFTVPFFAGALGCRPKASQAQCDELIDRYADLVTREKSGPNLGSPAELKAARDRERGEARGDDLFKNCRSEVSQQEYSCAMRASTSEQLVKCLE